MSFYHLVFRMGFFQLLQGINLKKAEVSGSQRFFKRGVLKISYYSQKNTCVGVLKAKDL